MSVPVRHGPARRWLWLIVLGIGAGIWVAWLNLRSVESEPANATLRASRSPSDLGQPKATLEDLARATARSSAARSSIPLVAHDMKALIGRVCDAQGAPIAEAEVRATEWDQRATDPTPGTAAATDTHATADTQPTHGTLTTGVRSDAEGRFSIEGLAAGVYRIRVRHPDWAPAELGPIDVPRTAASELVVRMSRGFRLRGRALHLDRSPVAGAEVVVSRAASGALTVEREALCDPLTTAADGTFASPVLERVPFDLWVSVGRSSALLRGLAPTDEAIDIVLADGEAIAGSVIGEEDRAPIAGAAVSLSELPERRALADALGRFRVEGLPKGEWMLSVESPLHLSRVLRCSTAGGACEIALVVRPHISGSVVCADGTPAAGARLVLAPTVGVEERRVASLVAGDAAPSGREQDYVLTGADGRFDWRPDVSGRQLELRARHQACGEAVRGDLDLAAGSSIENLNLRLAAGGNFSGRVQADDGSALAGARIEAFEEAGLQSGLEFPPRAIVRGQSGEDGTFRIALPPSGSWSVRFTYSELAPHVEQVTFDEARRSASTIVTLDAGAEIFGFVHSSAGETLSDAEVACMDLFGVSSQTADAQGLFRFKHLPQKRFTILASAAGYVEAMIPDVQPSAAALEVRLEAGGRMRGVVLDRERGLPITKFRVTRTYEGRDVSQTEVALAMLPLSFSSNTGEFELYPLRSGQYTLHVEADGFAAATRTGVSTSHNAAAEKILFELEASTGIQGQVLDRSNGEPVPRAEVVLYLKLAQPDRHGFTSRRAAAAFTDSSGRFSLKGFEAGDGTLNVQARGYVPARQKVSVPAPTQASLNLEFRLLPAITVKGTILDSQGAPRRGSTSINASGTTSTGEPFGLFAQSEDDGSFVLNGLEIGRTYSIEAITPDADGKHRRGARMFTAHVDGEECSIVIP